ncbi:hypothetical protein R80B4_00363 [Fibrobacteres bacterium R8-0-B4]
MTFFNRQGRAALLLAAVGLGLLAAGCGKKDAPATDAAAGTALADPRDGQKYNTVKIGGQTWMAQNLNYQTESGSWCYGDDKSNCDKYGRLYDWNTAKTACPKGWKLPSKKEWEDLAVAAGGTYDYEIRGVAGKKLKAGGGWNDYDGKNANGTDDFGFSALPGGNRLLDGGFYDEGGTGYWWTGTQIDNARAYVRHISNAGDIMDEGYGDKGFGYSVRCIKE